MTATIDSCYYTLIGKLTDQKNIQAISMKLLTYSSNYERTLFVYELLQRNETLPSVFEVNKTEYVSTLYRNHGNQCFQKKDDYKAWQYYNLSLLHAPLNSKNYCMALANRSAVFHSLKKYKECLIDIRKVFSMTYPEELKEKLMKRLCSCEQNLSNQPKSSDDNFAKEIEKILTMRGPPQKRYPCASTKVEVVFNETMGRHVVAAQDIKAGEILVQENPYFTLLLKDQYLFSCNYCLSRNMNLLPCEHCCFSLYCSPKCKEKAWKEYHSIECALVATLVKMDFTKIELLALRTVIKARNDHQSWKDLFSTIEDAEKNFVTQYRGHTKVDNEWVYDSQYYTSIHSLATNIEKRSNSDIFQKCVTAAVFLHLLSTGTNFFKGETEEEKIMETVAGMLLLHAMTSPTNMHSLTVNIQNAEGHFVDDLNVGSAPYAFHSLINHSCIPNVVRFNRLGSGLLTLFAIRPIKKGMQLFDNYGYHHALQDRITRQKELYSQYKFTCLCEACINDWPTYLSMTLSTHIPSKIIKQKNQLLDMEAIENLQSGDRGTALKLFKPLVRLLVDLDRYAPCRELADCQESFKQCLSILEGDLIPHGQRNLVAWEAFLPKV